MLIDASVLCRRGIGPALVDAHHNCVRALERGEALMQRLEPRKICTDNVGMTNWLVFNGDADGLCAAHQLRLSGVRADRIVTGVKRDIALLARCDAESGDVVRVLDVSLDSNRDALMRLLGKGVEIHWFDHHFAGSIPQAAGLHAHIDTSAAICTSLLVDQFVQGRFRRWAIAAAFGDNMAGSARLAAREAGLSEAALVQLAELGELLNYNAYGETVADLHVEPAVLLERLTPFDDPFRFMDEDGFVAQLRDAMRSDFSLAQQAQTVLDSAGALAVVLPNEPWARRVQGVFANDLARGAPQRAHAILVEISQGYSVSVRAPMSRPAGADVLCRQFATGGGRAGAAGVNLLPATDLPQFLTALRGAYPEAAPRDPISG